jgi:hypothetical protein
MGLIKESKNVDLLIKSEPWTEKELQDFSALIKAQKAKRKKHTLTTKKTKAKKHA